MLVVSSFRAELLVVGLVGTEAVGVAVDVEHDVLVWETVENGDGGVCEDVFP